MPWLGRWHSTLVSCPSRVFEHLLVLIPGVAPASPFLGPEFGPIIAGFVNQHINWRWTWWILVIWAAFEFVALFLFVPETFVPRLLVLKARKLRKAGRTDVKAPLELDPRSIPKVILISCRRPFGELVSNFPLNNFWHSLRWVPKPELLFTEPMAAVLCTWTALLLGILYMFFSAFSIVYSVYGL